jgi:integrase/recombinase XerD
MKHLTLYNEHFRAKKAAFEKHIRQLEYSESSQRTMPSAVKELLYWMEQNGIDELEQIDQELINSFFEYLEYRPNKRRTGGVGNKHLNKYAQAILRFVEFVTGTKKGCSGITKSYKISKGEPIEILTQAEAKHLFDSLGESVYDSTSKAIIACLYGLGLRLSELYRLNETDVNFSLKEVAVRKTKNGEGRIVPMNDYVSQVLEVYMFRKRVLMADTEGAESAFVLSSQGRRMAKPTIKFRVCQIVGNAGIDKHITPHKLRHSFGTHLVQNGLTAKEVSWLLGHKTLDSTMLYLHMAKLYI